jgi:Flp pilus assembly protein TadD
MKLNDAKQAIKNSDFEKAILILSEIISNGGDNYEPFAVRAVAYRKIKNFQLSVDDFEKAIELDPQNADLRTEKGVSLFHQKSIDLALLEMNIAVSLEPNNPYRYSSRAFIKDALQDLDGAIADYQKAIELDPEDDIAHNNLGMLEEKKGNIEKAKKHFNKSEELQGIDMEQIAKDAVKDGGVSVKKNEAKKEVIEFEKQNKIIIKEKNTSRWQIIAQVFSNKEVFMEFIQYIKALFSKRK